MASGIDQSEVGMAKNASSTVGQVFEDIGANLDMLGEAVTMFEQRLENVLRPINEKESDAMKTAAVDFREPDEAHLLVGARDIDRRIANIRSRILTLTGRVQA